MISIDKLAYTSELRKANSMEKFIFSVVTMVVCISLNNMTNSIIILLLMSAMILLKGKIPVKTYGELLLIPLVFLIIGTLTIAINMVPKGEEAIFSFAILGIRLGCTTDSLLTALKLFFKCLASVSCLYFLTLTTPVFEVLSVLRRLKAPKLFVELMGLIYRFIFVLLDTANMIFVSQNSRLGYNSFKNSYNSLGKLITALFISAYKRSLDIYISMESRCYDGEINLFENYSKISYRNILLIFLIEVALVFLSFSKFGGAY